MSVEIRDGCTKAAVISGIEPTDHLHRMRKSGNAGNVIEVRRGNVHSVTVFGVLVEEAPYKEKATESLGRRDLELGCNLEYFRFVRGSPFDL